MFLIFLSPSYFIQHSALTLSGVIGPEGGGGGGGAGAAAVCCDAGAAGARSAELLPAAQAESASKPQTQRRRSDWTIMRLS